MKACIEKCFQKKLKFPVRHTYQINKVKKKLKDLFDFEQETEKKNSEKTKKNSSSRENEKLNRE